MDQARWNRIQDLFHRVCDVPYSEREAFLQVQCGDDADLKNFVMDLFEARTLSFFDGSHPFFDWTAEGPDEGDPLQPGQSFGSFEVERKLGEGGMGSVWLAWDTRLLRHDALKFLNARAIACRLELLKEAQAASRLRHVNVVTVYDVGEFENRPYIVSEYVEGVTLRSRLTGQPLPSHEIDTIVSPLISALRDVHAAGIIHRDLKPENILINNSGQIKLTDFGLAKLVRSRSADPSQPDRHVLLGTPGYMSPEQIRGEEIDEQTDIWSLGVLVYELTVGEKPFQGCGTLETLLAIEKQPVPEVLGRLAPPGWERIVRRALEKDKAARYRSVAEFEEDWSGLARRARKNRIAYTGAAALIGALTLALWVITHRPVAPFVPGPILRLTDSGDVTMAAISPDGRFAASVKGGGAKQSIVVRDIKTGKDREIRSPAPVQYGGVTFTPDSSSLYYTQDDLRQFRILYSISPLGGPPRRILDDVDSPVAFSAKGSKLAFVRHVSSKGESRLLIGNVDGSGVRVIVTLHTPESIFDDGLDWSEDSRSIVFRSTGRLGRKIARVDLSGHIDYPVSESPAWMGRLARMGNSRAFIVPMGSAGAVFAQLFQLDLRTGSTWQITNGPARYTSVTATSDGNELLTVMRDRVSSLWISDKMGRSRRIAPAAERYFGATWMSAGRLLVQKAVGSALQILQLNAEGTEERSLFQSSGINWKPRASPDGRYIVFLSSRNQGWHIWRADADGSNQKQLTFGSGEDSDPEWSPDSRWIYYGEIFELKDQLRRISSTGTDSTVISDLSCRKPSASADGHRLACECHKPQRPWQLGWLQIDTGMFYAAGISGYDDVPFRWIPGENALSFVETSQGLSNLAKFDFDSRVRQPITFYDDQQIFDFDWNREGTHIVVTRGRSLSDTMLLSRSK